MFFIAFWVIKRLFTKFQQFTQKSRFLPIEIVHYHIRANNLLKISAIYFYLFPNFKALKSLIFGYHRIGTLSNDRCKHIRKAIAGLQNILGFQFFNSFKYNV